MQWLCHEALSCETRIAEEIARLASGLEIHSPVHNGRGHDISRPAAKVRGLSSRCLTCHLLAWPSGDEPDDGGPVKRLKAVLQLHCACKESRRLPTNRR